MDMRAGKEATNIVPFTGGGDLISREEIATAVQLWRFDNDLSEALTRQELGAMTFPRRVDAQRKALIIGFVAYLRKHKRSDVAMGVYLITMLLSDNDRGESTVSQETLAKLFKRSVSSIADAQKRLREDSMIVTGRGRYAGSAPVIPRVAALQHNNLTWIVGALASEDKSANHPAPPHDCQSSGPAKGLSQSSGETPGLKSINHPVDPISIIRPDPMQSLTKNSTTLKEREEVCSSIKRTAAAVAIGMVTATTPMALAAHPANPPAIIQQSATLEDRLLDAGGIALANAANSAGLLILSEPHRWLSQGFDLELDILPAIRGRSLKMPPGSIKSWSYFTQAVADAKAKRTAPMPEGNASVVAVRAKNWHDEQDEIRAKLKAVWAKNGQCS